MAARHKRLIAELDTLAGDIVCLQVTPYPIVQLWSLLD
jgi:hypothetical protein